MTNLAYLSPDVTVVRGDFVPKFSEIIIFSMELYLGDQLMFQMHN